MSEYGYIYKTTNLINGRIYIGQRHGTFSPSYLGSGFIIQRAVKEYGKNNFKLEVLAYATTRAMLNGLEMKFIYEYRQVFGERFLYNISNGGEAPMMGRKHSKETKLKYYSNRGGKNNPMFGVSLKGKLHPNFGKNLNEETKNKISEKAKSNPNFGKWNIGRKWTPEQRIMLSERRRGIPSSTGRKQSQETRDKISKSRKELFKQKVSV